MNAPFLADLAILAHPALARFKAFALLTAYLDESGMHGSARATVVAGAVGLPDQWRQVEREWRIHLDRFGLIDPSASRDGFHAQPCQRGRDEFKHIPEDQRNRLILALAGSMADHGLTAIGSAVALDDWRSLDAPDLKKRFPKPYNLAFEHCIQQINSWSAENVGGEKVSLVFAQHQEFAKIAAKVGEAYQRSVEFGAQISGVSFADARQFGMVQTGDLIAYESYRWAEQMIAEDQTLRPAMQVLAATGRMKGGFYNAEALSKLAARGPVGIL